MKRERFQFALQCLDHTNWALFEAMASAFLAPEYPSLRTVASPSGDGGRDAALFSPTGNSSVMLQYSVTTNWDTKIKDTAEKLKKNFPSVRILSYVTNRSIGADADDLRQLLSREYDLFLDVRDESWFLERVNSDRQREAVAEDLAVKLVDPCLASRGVIASKTQALTTPELQAALLYLGLQWEDDTREKGLTKLSFDALVRSVLRGTDPEHRMSRTEVKQRIREILPTQPADQVDANTDATLARLAKKHIRHHEKTGDFCLTYDERQHLRDRLTVLEQEDLALQKEIDEVTANHWAGVDGQSTDRLPEVSARVRRVLEKFLLGRGELFVTALKTGRFEQLGFGQLKDLVIRDIGERPDKHPMPSHLVDTVTESTIDLLRSPGTAAQRHLRSLADSYTLLAFLRETPDVQAAVSKMFSYGEIWLDTSVLLPLFAEFLAEAEHRQYTNMLGAAVDAGLDLFITKGVAEEVVSHMRRSLMCSRATQGTWEGRVPFLYSLYVISGRPLDGFAAWLENFRGDSRPEDDIAEYLEGAFHIRVGSLEVEAKAAPEDLRIAVSEFWHAAHERRRSHGQEELAPWTAARLTEHDTENYLGVIGKRGKEEKSPFGYGAWLLTLDSTAFSVQGAIKEQIKGPPPASPVMGPDFLTNYLVFGPMRMKISKDVERVLPVILDADLAEVLPQEVLAIAEKVRQEADGLPEHVKQRRVRDEIEKAKRRIGRVARGGVTGVAGDLKKTLGQPAPERRREP